MFQVCSPVKEAHLERFSRILSACSSYKPKHRNFCDSVPGCYVCQMYVKKREEISENTTRQRMDGRWSISINTIINNWHVSCAYPLWLLQKASWRSTTGPCKRELQQINIWKKKKKINLYNLTSSEAERAWHEVHSTKIPSKLYGAAKLNKHA